MAVLPIIKIGHPTLRKRAQEIEEITPELRELANNMIDTMRLNEGVGLAANQVNVLQRLFVIDLKLIDEKLDARAYVNPEILETESTQVMEEGCLSIPKLQAEVERAYRIKVRYQTLDGEEVEEEMEDLLARVFQHEMDHLNGVLFIDRVPPLTRKMLDPQIRKIQEAYSLT